MKVSEMFPSRFLRGEELRGPVTVTIQRVGQEQVHKPGEGETTAFVLYAVNGSRGVILTKPLAVAIAAAVGSDDTDHWPGKRVTLFPQPMTVAGRAVVAIRARAAADPEPAPTNGKA